MAGDRAQCEISQMSARLVNGKMRGTQPEVLLGFCFDHRRLNDWQESMVEKGPQASRSVLAVRSRVSPATGECASLFENYFGLAVMILVSNQPLPAQ